MEKVTVKAKAKVNLSLNITGVNGSYHELESVMVSVSLCNEITATKNNDKKAFVRFSKERIENSNAQKIASYMIEEFSLSGVDIYIEQNIPSGGGVGGSSADGAGVIRAIDELFSLSLPRKRLEEIGAKFGSDIPFMVTGGVALVRGRGEKIEWRKLASEFPILLAYKGEVSTKECFALFDKDSPRGVLSDNNALTLALERGEIVKVREHLGNALQSSAIKLNPCIDEILRVICDSGLSSVMTGSGACVIGLGEIEEMEKAKEVLLSRGIFAQIVYAQKEGYEIV